MAPRLSEYFGCWLRSDTAAVCHHGLRCPAYASLPGEYGLTEERLYATAFMGWLAAVFLWFAATVMAGRRERFAFGAIVAGFLLVIVLSALNPDALIARTNLARAKTGRPF